MARTTYPRTIAGVKTMLHAPQWNPTGAGLRGIIGFHGHGAGASQFDQGQGMGKHPAALANAGFAVLAHDTPLSGLAWNNGASSDAETVSAMGAAKYAYNQLKDVVGVAGTKVGVIGWSMGGGMALQFIKQNPTLVACAWLFSPMTDLDFYHATAGYTPAYDAEGITPNAAYAAEIDTAYGGNYAVNAVGHKIRDEYATWAGLGIKIMIDQTSDDPTVPRHASDAFVAGVNDPNVTLYSPAATGGHPGAVVNRDPKEVVDFFQANLLAAA